MTFSLTRSVEHAAYVAAGEDELGNEVASYALPVTVRVFGWEPPRSDEPALAGHDRVVVDLKLYAPQSMGAKPADRVVVNGKRFEVIGWPEDPNDNGIWSPGLVSVNLRRIEG